MKKAILLFHSLLFLFFGAFAQDHKNFVKYYADKADVIFEGKIVARNPLEMAGSNRIFTKNKILVSKIWKGENPRIENIDLLTEGGQTADRVTQTPEFGFLYEGFSGVFFAKNTPEGLKILHGGLIHYDKLNRKAGTMQQVTFENIEKELYSAIQESTGATFREMKALDLFIETQKKGNARTEAVEISSFIPTEVTGGTLMKLTINGSGFGNERGTEGNVFFTNNTDGGATMRQLVEPGFFRRDYDAELISWSDTKIEVYVPYFAGTGKISVTNDKGERFDSFDKLQVRYAVTTIRDFGGGIGIPGGEEEKIQPAQNPLMTNQNNSGGYTVYVDPKVFTNDKMMGAIKRALERWRCQTGINISIAANQANVGVGYSGKSVIAMPDEDFGGAGMPFGIAFSNHKVCNTGTKKIWSTEEFQIYVNVSPSWLYDNTTPTARQMDFESMMTRLFARAAQVEYVNVPTDPMYFQLRFGENKRVPSAANIEAVNYILKKSFDADPDCGAKGMKAIAAADCNKSVEAPLARFTAEKTEFCEAPAKVQFKDDSRNPASYEWTFTGGTPATSTEKNPIVSYDKAGTYSVTLIVKNAGGSNTATKTNYIKIGGVPITVDLGADQVVCQGTKVTLDTKIADATYEWSNGGTTQKIEVTQAGTYSVKVTKNGCEAKGQVKVSFSEPVSAGQSRAICLGETIQLQATGGLSYSWSPARGVSNPNIANPTVTPTETTFYTVTAKTANCGEIKASVRITVDKKPVILGLPVDREIILCDDNATAYLNAFAEGDGIEYEWSHGIKSSFVAIQEAGKYWVKVKNATGCVSMDTVTIKRASKLTVSAGKDTTICQGSGVQLMATGGDFYVWSPADGLSNQFIQNPIARPFVTTVYTVRARGTGNCEPVTAQVKVSVVDRPVLNLPKTIEVCKKDTVLDTKIENATFTWSTGSKDSKITVSKSGIYFVTVRPKYCPQVLTASVTVTFPSEGIKVDLGKDTVVCHKDWELDAGVEGLWNTGEKGQFLRVNKSGTYSVEFTDNCGKIYRDTVKVTFDRLEKPFANRKINVCDDRPVVLNAKNTGKFFRWSTGSTLPEISVSQSGTYFLTITDKCNNELRDTVSVFFEKSVLEMPFNIYTCDRQLTLDAQVPNSQYEWSNGAKTQKTTVSEDGNYTVKVKTTCEKELTGSTQVFFFEKSTLDFDFKIEGDGRVVFNNKSKSTHSVRYEWNFADLGKSTETNPIFSFEKVGTYKIKLTMISQNCQGTKSFEKDVQIIVSSNPDHELARKITTYPNPAKDEVRIKWNGINQAKKIRILDLIGKKWFEQNVNTPESETILNIAGLSKGLYFLEIQTEGKKLVKKLLVE